MLQYIIPPTLVCLSVSPIHHTWTRLNHRDQPLLIETTLLVKILDVESEIFGEEHVKDDVHNMCVLCVHVYFQQNPFKHRQLSNPNSLTSI